MGLLQLPDSSVKNPNRVRERREALVRAAVEVFAELGYNQSRVSDVAERAGFSQGTVYNYVKSKEDLLYLICEDHALGFEKLLHDALDGVTDPRAKLDALLQATVDGVFHYRDHYLIMLRELHNVARERRPLYMKLTAKQRQFCQDVLCEIAEHEPLIIPNPIVSANLLIYLPKIIVSRGWDLKNAVSDEDLAVEIMNFARRGLGISN